MNKKRLLLSTVIVLGILLGVMWSNYSDQKTMTKNLKEKVMRKQDRIEKMQRLYRRAVQKKCKMKAI